MCTAIAAPMTFPVSSSNFSSVFFLLFLRS